jgi:hypothetical protein
MHRPLKSFAFAAVTAALGVAAAAWAAHSASAKGISVTQPSEVKWTPMNPQAGDKGPQLAVVFGDPSKGPFGALMKFPAGTRPGPHIHSSDYWGVVVSGQMADFAAGGDEGKAVAAGGYYFQPARVPHDNHCVEGSDCVLFVYMPHALDSKPASANAEK